MPTIPYLFFGGNCAEAMRFYEKTFGGKLDALMTYGEHPPGEGFSCPDALQDKIMHAHLILPDGSTLMASDDMSPGPYKGMSGYSVAVSFKTLEEVKRVFDALSEGGHVWMPLGRTFWSEAFGMCSDRFGAGWMVSLE